MGPITAGRVARLADALQAKGVKADNADSLSVSEWQALARELDIPVPSLYVRRQVVGRLRSREAVASLFNIPDRKAKMGEAAAFTAYWEEKGQYGSTPEEVARLAWSAACEYMDKRWDALRLNQPG